MSELITFEEKVRAVGKRPDNDNCSVIFRTRAAFYWIKPDREDEIKLLQESGKNSSPVKITCDAITREIMEVAIS